MNLKKALWIMGIVFASIIIGVGIWVVVGTLSQKGPTNENGYPAGINRTDMTAQERPQIAIRDLSFSPPNIIVKKGTTVTWTNNDSMAHSIIADDPTNTGGIPTKDREHRLGKGDTFVVTFTQVGTFDYVCGVHAFMRGSVQVVEE